MGIHRRKTIVMRDIQHVTIAVGRHADAADITIGHGIHLLAFHTLRPNVKTGMDVVGTDFSKGSRQHNRNIKRVAVLRIGLSGRTDGDRHGKQNQ